VKKEVCKNWKNGLLKVDWTILFLPFFAARRPPYMKKRFYF